MSMPVPETLNPAFARGLARETGKDLEDVYELAGIVAPNTTLADFLEALSEPECANTGCTRPRSNFSDECFECRFEPFGSEWQREQEERGW